MRRKKLLLICGVGALRAPPMFSMKRTPETIFFFYTVGDGCLNTQNPKNEPPIMKTLDLRVNKSFHLKVGNHENKKYFLTSNFQMDAINYRWQVECSSFFQMKRTWQILKAEQKNVGSDIRFRYHQRFYATTAKSLSLSLFPRLLQLFTFISANISLSVAVQNLILQT